MRVPRLAFLFAGCAFALAAQVPPDKIQAIERMAAQAMEKDRIPALSIAVATADGPVWSSAWGFADLENFVPAKKETTFRLGSISKPVTSVSALKLVEEGKIELDAEVQRYVPSFPRKAWPVTVRQLLSHQAGIRHYKGDEASSARHYWNLGEALGVFAADPVLHEPGTKYLYSTYGFNLAGAAIEGAAGMPYAEYVRRAVFEPLGITTMRADDIFAVVPNRARGYRKRADGSLENCSLMDASNKVPGGGWLASTEDLVKFGRGLLDGRLLGPRSIELMWTANKLKDGSSTGYGLGWGIEHHDGQPLAVHQGGQAGCSTYLLLSPARKLVIVVLTNLEGADVKALAQGIYAELAGARS